MDHVKNKQSRITHQESALPNESITLKSKTNRDTAYLKNSYNPYINVL